MVIYCGIRLLERNTANGGSMIEAFILCVLGTILITWCVWLLMQASKKCTHTYEQTRVVKISERIDGESAVVGIGYHLKCAKCGDITVKKFFY